MSVSASLRPRPLVIRVGHVWLSHSDLAALEHRETPVVCDGDLRFVHTDGRLKEAQCDCCGFFTTATVEHARVAFGLADERERVAAFNREAYWQR